ncbi:TniQ family protein [Candidatus Phyllobacterium onerii]|uniref:TniQ family protein n=1 Tax=Candidatus Phyllobacterium onerii TaxID=3020828 RepID=UPI003A896F12
MLPPAADEILSSWISRHAAFYGVPPMTMLQHCLPQATSLGAVDLCLTRKQA